MPRRTVEPPSPTARAHDTPATSAVPVLPQVPQVRPLFRVQMAKRGVRSVRALYQMLAPYDVRAKTDEQGRRKGQPPKDGLRLSLAQLHALVNGEAKQINLRALGAICAVLQCNVNDLYDVTTEAEDAP